MTSKDRRYGRTFAREGTSDPDDLRISVLAPTTSPTGNGACRHLIKSGHAFYVVNPNNLFVRGVPFRNNYNQFSAGLP
jgi:hypothetical protein